MRARLPVLLAALWWGSLTSIGFLVVPMLFAHLPTPAMAGHMAGKLFGAQTWVSMACGLVLLMLVRPADEEAPDHGGESAGTLIALVVPAMLMALLSEFAVAPHILARDNLRLWHSVGTVLYVLQWLCAGALLWRFARPQD